MPLPHLLVCLTLLGACAARPSPSRSWAPAPHSWVARAAPAPLLTVADMRGCAVPHADVEIRARSGGPAYRTTTTGDGATAVHRRMAGLVGDMEVHVRAGDETATATWDGAHDLTIRLDAVVPRPARLPLDVLVLVDAPPDEATLLAQAVQDALARPDAVDLRLDVLHWGRSPGALQRAVADAMWHRPWRDRSARLVLVVAREAPPQMRAADIALSTSARRALQTGVRVHAWIDGAEQGAHATLGDLARISRGGLHLRSPATARDMAERILATIESWGRSPPEA